MSFYIIPFVRESFIRRITEGKILNIKSKEKLFAAPPISANSLLGRTIEEHILLPLAQRNIDFYKLKTNKAKEYIGVVNLKLNGIAFNLLLLSMAPNKAFGLDTRDILNDWKIIDQQSERKARHEAMGKAWHIFDRDRLYFREIVEKDFDVRGDGWRRGKKDGSLVPLIRWRVGKGNKREIVYDLLDPSQGDKYQEIISRHIAGYHEGMDLRFLNPTIGYYTAVHFSEEIKSQCNKSASYSSECERTQSIGATQVGPYAIMIEHTMLESPFYSRAEEYIESKAQVI